VTKRTLSNDIHTGLADPEHRMTLLEYLQEPPAKASPSTIERQSGKVSKLLELGADCYKTDMVPALLHSYAQGMRKRRPSRFHQLQEPSRSLELVAFMRYALLEHTDNLIRLIDRCVARLWGRACEDALRTRHQPAHTGPRSRERPAWVRMSPLHACKDRRPHDDAQDNR